MSEDRCYYDGNTRWGSGNTCEYGQGLWQCQTCGEWYCYYHDHDTELGYCVECCVCEETRLRERGSVDGR